MKSHRRFSAPCLRAPAFLLTLLAIGLVAADCTPSVGAAEEPSLPSWALHDEGLLRRRGERLSLLGAAEWHTQGYRGRGVKVAVLDSGFRGYGQHLGKA